MNFIAGQCYACGETIKDSKIDPQCKCRCGAPICSVCWQKNIRTCADHQDTIMLPPSNGYQFSFPYKKEEKDSDEKNDEKSQVKGGISIDIAKNFENKFISSFIHAISTLKVLVSPMDGKQYEIDSAITPVETDSMGRLKLLMEKRGMFDKTLLLRTPVNRSIQFPVYHKGLLGKKNVKLYIVATSLISIEDALMLQRLLSPPTIQDCKERIESFVIDKKVFYIIGIFSPTGWPLDIQNELLEGPNWLSCLVEKKEETSWQLYHNANPCWDSISSIYNPETEKERFSRIRKYITSDPQLALKGGYIKLDEIKDHLKITEQDLNAVLDELITQDTQLSIVEVKGHRLLKRKRV